MLRRPLVFILALSVVLLAGRAEAVTVRDVIELSKAGLGDSVLLALIDVDRSVFSIDNATLKQLKAAGVSDAVIVAMIRSGREPQPVEVAQPIPPQPAPVPEPSPTTEAAPQPAPIPYPVAVPVPVYVAVPVVPSQRVPSKHLNSIVRTDIPLPPNCVTASVPNWGFGGKSTPAMNLCR